MLTKIEVDALSAIIRISKSLRDPNWEQRRYEIARDFYVHNPGNSVGHAVAHADRLIEALKKGGEQ